MFIYLSQSLYTYTYIYVCVCVCVCVLNLKNYEKQGIQRMRVFVVEHSTIVKRFGLFTLTHHQGSIDMWCIFRIIFKLYSFQEMKRKIRKNLAFYWHEMASKQECYELFWTNPRSNTPWNNSCTATYLPSQKIFKKDERDIQDTASEPRTK